MARITESSPNYERVMAFNTGFTLLRGAYGRSPIDSPEQASLRSQIALIRHSLGWFGQPENAITNLVTSPTTFNHQFSRTGTNVDISSGILVREVYEQLRESSHDHASEATGLLNMNSAGFLVDKRSIAYESNLTSRYEDFAQTIKNNSLPISDVYNETHPDWEAAVEAYAYWWTHQDRAVDSNLEPSLEHNESDWYKAVEILKNEWILKLEPEVVVAESARGRRRFFGAPIPFSGSRKGCLPLAGLVAIPLIALAVAKCPGGQSGETKEPTPIVAEAVPTPSLVEIPSAPAAAGSEVDCQPGDLISITTIEQQGDSDAVSFSYPEVSNGAQPSLKGLYEKKLAESYAKENPYSDASIRFNDKIKANKGKDVAADDPDLAELALEARLFYTDLVSDAGYLAFVDSINRNSPYGSVKGDLITAAEIKGQAPEAIIKRLQTLSLQ